MARTVDDIMENYSPLWFSVDFLSKYSNEYRALIGARLEYDLTNKYICKRSKGKRLWALRSRYVKETPWWKRVLSVLANRIY